MSTQDQPKDIFYSITMDDSDPLGMMYAGKEDLGFDGNRLKQAELIEEWPDGITFYIKGDHLADLLLCGGYWVIVSDHFRQALQHCEIQGAQFLPVRVENKDSGEQVDNYWVLNVTNMVEALDWEHTYWQKPTGIEDKYPRDKYPLLYIMEVALQSEPLKDIDLFRLGVKGDCTPSIYLSERTKQCLESQETIRGIYFAPVPAF